MTVGRGRVSTEGPYTVCLMFIVFSMAVSFTDWTLCALHPTGTACDPSSAHLPS